MGTRWFFAMSPVRNLLYYLLVHFFAVKYWEQKKHNKNPISAGFTQKCTVRFHRSFISMAQSLMPFLVSWLDCWPPAPLAHFLFPLPPVSFLHLYPRKNAHRIGINMQRTAAAPAKSARALQSIYKTAVAILELNQIVYMLLHLVRSCTTLKFIFCSRSARFLPLFVPFLMKSVFFLPGRLGSRGSVFHSPLAYCICSFFSCVRALAHA